MRKTSQFLLAPRHIKGEVVCTTEVVRNNGTTVMVDVEKYTAHLLGGDRDGYVFIVQAKDGGYSNRVAYHTLGTAIQAAAQTTCEGT